MVIRAAGDDFVAAGDKGRRHCPGVGDHLLLVAHKFRARRLLEAHRLGGDDMHQGAALAAGENRRVEFLLQFLVGPGQDKAAAGAAQGFVGSGGHHVRKRDGVGVDPGGHQACHVGHIDHQVGADPVGNRAEAGPVHHPRVGGKTGDDQLRLVLQGQGFHLLVVHLTGDAVQAVLDRVIDPAGKIDAGAVGEVTAIRQAHTQNGIAGGTQGQEDRRVRLGAGMGLHIGIGGAEQCLGPLNGEGLGLVHVFTAAVIALAGIALSVFIGQRGALGRQHARAGVVFRGNQLDMLLLATLLFRDGREYLVVESLDAHVFVEHGVPLAGWRGIWLRPEMKGAHSTPKIPPR